MANRWSHKPVFRVRIPVPRLSRCSILKSMKYCGSCKQEKPEAEFNKRSASTDGLQPTCRTCNQTASRQYYRRNQIRHRQVTAAAKDERVKVNRHRIVAYLSEHPCVDCGVSDVRVLEFDHVRGIRLKGVAELIKQGYSWETVKREIAKCEVRCKNCHAIVTYARLGGSWHDKFLAL